MAHRKAEMLSTATKPLLQPCRRFSVVCAEFVLCFALRYALCFAVPAFGVSCFADGCAGFRRSRGFDISTTGRCDRSIALLAARTDRVVVARRRLFRFARRDVPTSQPHRQGRATERQPSEGSTTYRQEARLSRVRRGRRSPFGLWATSPAGLPGQGLEIPAGLCSDRPPR
jgi:hypothetical protein